jgi:hypothetical protein
MSTQPLHGMAAHTHRRAAGCDAKEAVLASCHHCHDSSLHAYIWRCSLLALLHSCAATCQVHDAHCAVTKLLIAIIT